MLYFTKKMWCRCTKIFYEISTPLKCPTASLGSSSCCKGVETQQIGNKMPNQTPFHMLLNSIMVLVHYVAWTCLHGHDTPVHYKLKKVHTKQKYHVIQCSTNTRIMKPHLAGFVSNTCAMCIFKKMSHGVSCPC